MNTRETFDGVTVGQRIDLGSQALHLQAIAAGADGAVKQSIQVLRDHYDRNSEAYLNGAICRVEYLNVVEQINQSLAGLIGSKPADGSGNGLEVLHAAARKTVAKAKGRQTAGKRKPVANAPCDADFAALVQRACMRLSGQK
jgi:hypothetical protein